MRIYEMEEERRTEELTEVWERSVKATHSFLPDTAREELKKIVPELLAEVPHLAVIEDDRGAYGAGRVGTGDAVPCAGGARTGAGTAAAGIWHSDIWSFSAWDE